MKAPESDHRRDLGCYRDSYPTDLDVTEPSRSARQLGPPLVPNQGRDHQQPRRRDASQDPPPGPSHPRQLATIRAPAQRSGPSSVAIT